VANAFELDADLTFIRDPIGENVWGELDQLLASME